MSFNQSKHVPDENAIRRCTLCNLDKPESAFSADRRWREKPRAQCKACRVIKSREYKAKLKLENPELLQKLKDGEENLRLLKRFGITLDQKLEMFASCDFRCVICGTHKDEKRLCVDHDHSTGKVREPLCVNCNSAIGSFKDSPELCLKAADYLRKHGKNG